MREDSIQFLGEPGEHPSDLADRLERMPLDAAQHALKQLPPYQTALILAEMDPSKLTDLLEGFDALQLVSWLRLLPPNTVADLLQVIAPDLRKEVITGLPSELTSEVVGLLRYSPDSAGGIMDNRFIALRSDQTVEECLTALRASKEKKINGVLYIYLTDDSKRLVGVLSLRDLVFAHGTQRLSEIMNRDVRFLQVDDDQEQIARQVQHYHFLGLPVVDGEGRLVGVVRMDDAMRVAQVEATEDMQLMVGLSGEERIWTPWKHSITKRLPWLGVNVLTALGAAVVVSMFEATVSSWTALVAFLPLICAVAGNAGNQALTVIIRSLAVGDVASGDTSRALRKELFIGAANGLVLAVVIALIAIGWKGSILLGLVAGVAMLLNQIIGALSGVLVPFGLKWFNIDPALASSILVTALTDTVGFLVFLGTATIAMRTVGLS